MRFLVLGGAGAIGSVIVRDLLSSDSVEEVVIGEIDKDRSLRLIQSINDGRLSFKHIDVRRVDLLTEEMKKYDVTINSTWFEYNLEVTKAAINAKARLIDLGGLYYMTLKQLELDEDARKAEASILIGCGEDPGISNIMVRYVSDRLDEVDSVLIRDGDRDLKPPQRITFKFSVKTMMNEWTRNAVIFRDGRYEEVPPLSGIEEFEFPEPVGRVKVCFSLHSELATIPRYIGKGLRYVDFKINYDFDMIDILKKFGFFSDQHITIDNLEISIKDLTTHILRRCMFDPSRDTIDDAACIFTKIIGKKDGRDIIYSMYALSTSKKEWNTPASSYLTGVPASIAAQMMVKEEIKFYGVKPPETCIPTEKFLENLSRKNIIIGERIEKKW
ncbi:MAG: saccharopine dehydrogenase NADP-binding domain-containing protein [Aigarchaeota archaeon]|nr:saccharopine dehydrogenase NADP-binding domain-containing protein [Candidatus Geocrenenecus dongiae]